MLILLLCLKSTSQASHGMGANITYSCNGNGQYVVTVQFFRDCSGVSPFTSYSLSYSSASCGVNSSTTVSQLGGVVDITPVCPSQATNCGGGGGSYGVELYTYQGVMNLPPGCGNDWVLGWTECCRNSAITTLNSPGSQNIFVSANLNNTLTPCNSSPVFNNPPTPFVCNNQPVSYNHGVTDPDGDSLRFSLVNCNQALGSSVAYGGGFSGINPLSTVAGVTINPLTGTITFTPNAVQIGVLCVRVQEYRGGVLIGETVRDMQFRVLNCNNQAPNVSGINGTAVYQMTVCVGSNTCFNVNGTDANGNNITMTWNNGIPGGVLNFQGNGGTSPTGFFCWTPTAADVGANFFTITAEDNACPVTGVSTYSYLINVVGTVSTVNAGADVSFCAGGSVALNATSSGASSYTWSPATGLSCTNCPNPVASPTSTTVYTVTANFPSGCNLSDNVQVSVNALPAMSITPGVAYICPSAAVTLSATAPTATSYLWSTGSTAPSITVSPSSTTSYWLQVTNAQGCIARDTATVNVNAPVATSCNVVYASPTGTGTGTQASPASLVNAINMASCNNTVIKLAIGTYTINNPISNIAGYVTLEGGFDPGNAWRKTSAAGATTITRSNLNPEDLVNQERLVAFYLSGATNVRFQDLTITTAGGTGNGMSTYGVHMTSCSNYTFTRCQVLPGAASAGAAGTVGGAGAAGSAGGGGLVGDIDDESNPGHGGNGGAGGGAGAGGGGVGGVDAGGCCVAGIAGAAGTASGNARAGGGGGGGGCGGEERYFGGTGGNGGGVNGGPAQTPGGAGGSNGDPGNPGSAGTTGTGGAAGAAGAAGPAGSISGCFWIPGGLGGTGATGTGGRGGTGGGGGGGQYCTFCDDGAGSGGGGGGGGGEGGLGGSGGRGGGSSYGIFLCTNGANGIVDDCSVIPGAAGAGGAGGNGGNGGAGGAGGAGNVAINEVGDGANGGPGGAGGAGGAGGPGQPGQSIGVHVASGSPLALTDANFNLLGQPTIFMSNISCVNTNVNYSTGSSVVWNFGANSAPVGPTGAAVTTQYSTAGRRDVVANAQTYTGFANIILASNIVPQSAANAPIIGGVYHVCAGSPVNFNALNPGINYIYHWTMGGGSTPNNYDGTAFANVNGAVFNTPGTYTISLSYETDCCGFSTPTTFQLVVDPVPVNVVTGPTAFCANTGTGVTLNASGGNSYTWAPASGLNTTTGSTVIAYPTSTTTYTLTSSNATGNCFDVDNVTVTVRQVNLAPTATAATCGANGTAAANPSGGSGSYSYIWSPGGQTTASISGMPPGTYNVTVTDNTFGCVSNATVAIAPGPGLAQPFISNVNQVSCNGATNGTATVAVTGGGGPFAFNWLPAGGTSATTVGLPAGTYAVTVIDFSNPACPTFAAATISQPNPLSMAILQNDSANCPTPNGVVTVDALGGTGPYTYNWGFATGQTQTGLAAGSYTVTATDSRGCTTTIPVTVGCILPVEYAYLQANPFNGNIRVDWATSEERNNLRFDVLRSEDGQSFRKVGEVMSRVGTGIGTDYSFVDEDVVPNLRYFYRLQQIDLNGTSAYSDVVSAILPATPAPIVKVVYPTPFEDYVNISLDVPANVELRVDVVNLAGQHLGISRKFTLSAGSKSVKLDLRELPAGIYFGKLYLQDAQVGSVKLVKGK
jgi:hypothetical protein